MRTAAGGGTLPFLSVMFKLGIVGEAIGEERSLLLMKLLLPPFTD
jgi:hypothetical protein